MTATVKTESAGPRAVSRSVQVSAPAAEIFALVHGGSQPKKNAAGIESTLSALADRFAAR